MIIFRYFLQPRDSGTKISKELGTLRIKLQYTSDYVFSSQFYDPLRNLVLQGISTEVSAIIVQCEFFL